MIESPVDRERIRGELLRGLGLVMGLAKLGPARKAPALHRVLQQLGVLERLPESWPDSPRLEPMPWGAQGQDFSPPQQPRAFDGPWPQMPVIDPGFAPPVLRIPREERDLHRRYNVLRYLGQIPALVPSAAARALRGPRLVALDDADFTALINHTSLSQFICTELDPHDREIFAAELAARPGPADVWAKIDASVIDEQTTLPGIYAAATVTLLRFDGTVFRPVAIHFRSSPSASFHPHDGSAWALARYFVIQALQFMLVLVFHPRLHFPGDTINALTRSLLPAGHRLAKLLRPHLRFTLGLHEAVIHHRRSVLHNSQREIYTPFPVTTEGIHAGLARGMCGIPGNAAYPSYRFGPQLLDHRLAYSSYRRDWYTAVRSFVARTLADLDRHDADVGRWADAISEWLPGFPDAEAIARGDALSEAVATYICEISIFHSADHFSYANIPLDQLPWRIRVPPPNRRVPPPDLDLDALVSPEDHFRHLLCHPMFFVPVVIERFSDIRYGFHDPHLREAERELAAARAMLDRRWSRSSFPLSHQIAAGLQY
jgi:hypothetical protein